MKPAGQARQALRDVLAAGVTGTYAALALAAGLTPAQAQATLNEMRRCGEARAYGRARAAAARVGSAPVVCGSPPAPPVDALAYVRQAWR